MNEVKFTTVDRILSKFHREIKNQDLNVTDAIEWIGEAIEFMEMPQVLEEDVVFLKVREHHAELPPNFHMVLQIARNNNLTEDNNYCGQSDKKPVTVSEKENCGKELPEGLDHLPEEYHNAFMNSEIYDNNLEKINYITDGWTYSHWTGDPYYKNNFTPVRLADSTFFNSIVCREKDQSIYNTCRDEYTLVGTFSKKLRFSFRKGEIALSYLKTPTDPETGYPLIPDNISFITAISYYLKWKLAEMLAWNGRKGYAGLIQESRKMWKEYLGQGQNQMLMPKTIDDYQDMMEQSHQMIPNTDQYYGYFGNLTGKNNIRYTDPDVRNHY